MSKIDWLEDAARGACEESWRLAPVAVRHDPYQAFAHAHGDGLLFGYRAGLETVAKLLEDPQFDAAPREVVAARVRDLVGQIEDAYIVKIP